MTQEITTEDCGCEFTTYHDENGSMTFLSRVRCKRHYDEQFIAEWHDAEGSHRERYTPSTVIPLEKSVKRAVKFNLWDYDEADGVIVEELTEDVDGEQVTSYRIEAEGCDGHRNSDGELWINTYEVVGDSQ